MCKLDIPNRCDLITVDVIKNILANKTFNTQYQPFICIKNNKVFAYEALARFNYKGNSLPPDLVLNICHKDIKLFSILEYELKKEQFKNRQKDKKLFINFDLHAINEKANINKFIELFTNQENFVIELVENSYLKINTEKLIDIFRKFKFEFAVDDFFKEDSAVSLFLLSNCDYLKLDKDILYQLKTNKFFYQIINGIVEFIHSQDKKIILEGIESHGDLKIAKELNIDLVQGFLFKEKFIDI